MRTIKKLIVILLCLSLFTFVACGSDNDDVDGGENIKLKVWVQTANQPQFFTWAAKRYKELTNGRVTINWTAMPSATLGSGLDAALGGNEAPDIAATWGGLIVPQLIKGNRIINIDDVIDSIGEDNLNSSALINEKDSEGKGWYSLPFSGFASPVVFYNKTFFDANGMQVPNTYDELVALCGRISGLGKEGISSGFGDWQMSHFMQAMHSRTLTVEGLNGLIGVNYEKNPFASATDPAKPLEGIEEGFSLLKSYCDSGIFVNNITGYNVSQAQSYFKNGLALMYAAPSSEYLELSSATFEIGAFLLPAAPAELASDDENAPSSLASGLCSDVFVINARTKYADEAKDFLKFLASEEAQKKLLEYFLFPSVKGITSDGIRDAYKVVFDAVLGDIYEIVNSDGYTPFYQSYSIGNMDGRIASLAQSVINGTITPAAAAENLRTFYASSGILK